MLSCPKCSNSMQKVTLEGITVDRCAGCYGIWFDALELKAIVETRGGRKLDVGSAELGKLMDATDRIDCPRCRTRMIGLVDNRHPEVKYEQCSVCGGALLDAGELKLIERRSLIELLSELLAL